MQWISFFCAVAAVWCGLAWYAAARALVAVKSATFARQPDPKLDRRLTDCESLLSELVAALSRIEARDKMRRVRAGKSAQEETLLPSDPAPTTIPAHRDSRGRLSDLSSAEIRRRIAQRIPLT